MRNRWRDLVFGFRLLLKNPGFTAVAVLALALGIGANTAIFSVVYATLLAPLPYNQPDRIVMVWSQVNGGHNGVSAGDFLDWQRQSTTLRVHRRMERPLHEPQHRHSARNDPSLSLYSAISARPRSAHSPRPRFSPRRRPSRQRVRSHPLPIASGTTVSAATNPSSVSRSA